MEHKGFNKMYEEVIDMTKLHLFLEYLQIIHYKADSRESDFLEYDGKSGRWKNGKRMTFLAILLSFIYDVVSLFYSITAAKPPFLTILTLILLPCFTSEVFIL